jgi:hypothetical protein
MMLAVLGILDIVIGLSILFRDFFAGVVMILGLIALLKGIFSVLGGMMSGFFFDILGWIDLAAGVILLFNLSVPLFWIVVIIKGVYSIIMGWL